MDLAQNRIDNFLSSIISSKPLLSNDYPFYKDQNMIRSLVCTTFRTAIESYKDAVKSFYAKAFEATAIMCRATIDNALICGVIYRRIRNAGGFEDLDSITPIDIWVVDNKGDPRDIIDFEKLKNISEDKGILNLIELLDCSTNIRNNGTFSAHNQASIQSKLRKYNDTINKAYKDYIEGQQIPVRRKAMEDKIELARQKLKLATTEKEASEILNNTEKYLQRIIINYFRSGKTIRD